LCSVSDGLRANVVFFILDYIPFNLRTAW